MNLSDKENTQQSESFLLYHLLLNGEYKEKILSALTPSHFPIYKRLFELASKHELGSAVFLDVINTEGLKDDFQQVIGSDLWYRYKEEATIIEAINYLKTEYAKRLLYFDPAKFDPSLFEKVGSVESTIINDDNLDSFLQKSLSKYANKVPTPFKIINNLLGGFGKNYILMAGKPSVGKSVLIEQSFWHLASLGIKCLFFSLEMNEDMVIRRQYQRLTGTNLDKVQNVSVQELENAKNIIKFNNADLLVGAFTISDIDREISKRQPECVFIDYLGSIVPANPRLKEYEAITQTTKELKRLQVKYGCAILCVCQLSRTEYDQPRMSDLRSSGQLEYDADTILTIWQTRDALKPNGFLAQIDCLKNRNGTTWRNSDSFQAQLFFEKERVSFREVTNLDEF